MKRNTRRRSLHTSDGMNPAPESANMNLPHNAADQDLFPVKTGKSSCPVTLTTPSATAPLAEIKDPQLRGTECMKREKTVHFAKIVIATSFSKVFWMEQEFPGASAL